jgi:hypothetical protein
MAVPSVKPDSDGGIAYIAVCADIEHVANFHAQKFCDPMQALLWYHIQRQVRMVDFVSAPTLTDFGSSDKQI